LSHVGHGFYSLFIARGVLLELNVVRQIAKHRRASGTGKQFAAFDQKGTMRSRHIKKLRPFENVK
jgi:hypothetical protein